MPHAMNGEGEVSGFGRLGPLGQGVELMCCRAPKDGAKEYRLSRGMLCQPRRVAHGWVEILRTCSVGPSSLMNASDLDALSFVL